MDFILGLFSLWQDADAQKLNDEFYSNMNYEYSAQRNSSRYSQNVIEIPKQPQAPAPIQTKYSTDYQSIVPGIKYKKNPFQVNYLPQIIETPTKVLPQPEIFKPAPKEIIQEEILPEELTKTTVIFAPHPDDEILCCSNKISNLLAQGENVKIVILTDGDAHSDTNSNLSQFYGQKRRLESIKAARRLGLSDDDIYFLGFPDGYLPALNGIPVTSKYTKRTKSPLGSYFAGTEFSRKNLKELISNIIATHPPDEVFIPSEMLDQHSDHTFTGKLVKEVLTENSFNPDISEYFIHGRNFVAESGQTNTSKLSLIDIFQSQFHDDDHKKFMEAFASIPEIFLEGSGLIAKE